MPTPARSSLVEQFRADKKRTVVTPSEADLKVVNAAFEKVTAAWVAKDPRNGELILGPMMEENFRRAVALAKGDFTTFLVRPIAATLLLATFLAFALVLMPSLKRARELAFKD